MKDDPNESWQDSQPWSSVDRTIQEGHVARANQEKGNKGSLKFSLWNSEGTGLLNRLFRSKSKPNENTTDQ